MPGVTTAAPLVMGQVMASANGENTGVRSMASMPRTWPTSRASPTRIAPWQHRRFRQRQRARRRTGIAIGSGVARQLGVTVGDRVKLISPDGAKTPFGTSPRVNAYKVVYIFTAGRYDIDQTRVYMPFAEAQNFFNRDGVADEIEVMVRDPEHVDAMAPALQQAAGEPVILWSWKDARRSFLEALTVEDNVMFVIMSVLVLIATMNIVSGLIMLVKNKGRDIGILRTMGLTEGSVLRIFFICGAGGRGDRHGAGGDPRLCCSRSTSTRSSPW